MTNTPFFNDSTTDFGSIEEASQASRKTTKEDSVEQSQSQQLPKAKSTRKYRKPIFWKSMLQLMFTLSALATFYGLGLYFIEVNYTYSILLAFPTAFFTVRTFILQHDCGHRSLFASPALNRWVGRAIGILTLTPFTCWKRFHFMHHASSGNLDKRGFGEIDTLTTEEYEQKSPREKFVYRMYRNPVVLFLFIPSILFFVRQRLTYYIPKSWVKERRSVHFNNLVLAVILLVMYHSEMFWMYLGYWMIVMALAATIGVWLFYVQHQFPHAYWRGNGKWSFVDASLKGASFYDLPKIIHWLTAYIGFHHIHHYDCSIPNYRLKECFKEIELFQNPCRLSVKDSFHCIHLKLWDIERNTMVGFN